MPAVYLGAFFLRKGDKNTMSAESKMDVRILTFKKNSFLHVSNNNEQFEKNKETYITAHYFDYFEFTKVDLHDNYTTNFMEKSYKTIASIRNKSQNKDIKIQQCIILLQYIQNEDEKKLLRSFWQNKASHIFVTMIKISNGNSSRLKCAKERILQIVEKYGRKNFSIYYTFDFSDIILLSKNISEDVYQNILWDINYKANNKEKIINDSITLYGINYNCYKKITTEIDTPITNNKLPNTLNEKRYKNLLRNKINVRISIGVQNQNLLKELKKFLDNSIGEDRYRIDILFGRRDITISLNYIEVINVIIIYHNLIKISNNTGRKEHAFLGAKIISSVHESEYIKNIIDNSCEENFSEDVSNSIFLHNLETTILKMVHEYNEKAKMLYMDITEIYNAIRELSKSFFSLEFLISIYYSFYLFLKICIKNITSLKSDNNNYDKICAFQSDYFSCINMLSHCTMHGEKCFIQAAPFSPLLIDIPPKILAFYTAIAYRIKDLLEDTNKQQLFSFIFIPDFKANIHVTPISFGSDEDNKLIAVYIHENMLYNPYRVVCTMIHEIAHFIGDTARHREKRLENLITSIIELKMYICYSKKGVFNLAKIISPTIIENIKKNLHLENHSEYYISYINEYLYKSNYLLNDIKKIDPNELDGNISYADNGIDLSDYLDESDSMYDYFKYQLSNCNNTKVVQTIIYKIMWDNIFNNYTFEKYNNFSDSVEQIIDSYKEAYSDLILCSLSGISLNEYIDIINKEINVNLDANNIDIEYLFVLMEKGKINLHLFLRIASITSVCFKQYSDNETMDNIDSINIQLIMHLVDYLKVCKESIDKKNATLDDQLSHLKTISNEEDFNFIYDETVTYSKIISEIVEDEN